MPKLLTVLSLRNDIGLDKCSTVALRTSVDSDNVGRRAILDGAERGGEICLCPEMSVLAQEAAPEQTRFILVEYRRILTVVYLQNVTTS